MGGQNGQTHVPQTELFSHRSRPVLRLTDRVWTTGAKLSPGQMPLSAVATAEELGGEAYDRLCDVMPSAMHLQPPINLGNLPGPSYTGDRFCVLR